MNEAEIMRILVDWNFWGNFREELKERGEYLSRIEQLFSPKTATIFLGIRRSGKSSLAYLFGKQFIEKNNMDIKNLLIVNFEDPRFAPQLTCDDLFKIYETYLKNLGATNPLIILDEVQGVDNWERFVRYLLEARKNHVIITGSSSKLLGKEVSEALAGRHVDIEISPLSFKEFLDFKGLAPLDNVEAAKHRTEISRYFGEYLEWGGFPEVVFSGSPRRKSELLARYFDDIIMKDVVKRFGVKEIEKLESLVNVLISNISTLQSFNRLKDRIGVSLDTIERFSKYLEISGMFLFLRKFEFSVGKQVKSIRKVYVRDPGFYNVKGFKFSENYGKLAENAVAVELFRMCSFNPKSEVYYWKNYQQEEVDFVVKEGTRVKQLIQVCWSIDEYGTKERETKALLKASNELKCENLCVITQDKEGEEDIQDKKISYVPLWKWLLEN